MKDYMLDPPELPNVPECPKCHGINYTMIYIGDEGVVGCDACIRRITDEDWWYELEEECLS